MMGAIKQLHDGRKNWIIGLVSAFALLLAGLFLIPFDPIMPELGLDPSWRYAINQAVAQHLVFGRDFIFTVGPLGSVYTGYFHPDTDSLMLAGSALLALGLCIGCAILAHPSRHLNAIALPLICGACLSRDVFFLVLPLILLLTIVRISLPPDCAFHLKLTTWIVAGLAVTTCAVAMISLVKGSFAIIGFIECGLAFLVLLMGKRRAALPFLAMLVLALCVAWAGAGQPLAALPNFFLAQGPVISGYTDAMSINGPLSSIFVYLGSSLALLVIFHKTVSSNMGRIGTVAFAGLLFTLFFAFKAGYVRQDGHAIISGEVLLLVGYCLACLLNNRVAVVTAIVSVAAWSFIVNVVLHFGPLDICGHISRALTHKMSAIHARLTDPESFRGSFENAKAKIREAAPLPHVQGTVDLYPVNLAIILAHDMRWSGRPIPQSYSVYHPRLDARNVAHLEGSRAPDNVFFAVDSIDYRLPSLDDSGSWLELLSRYRIVGYQEPYVQLKRLDRAFPSPIAAGSATATIKGKIKAAIPVSISGPVWATINLQPTLLGRVVSAVDKLPQVRITLTLSDGRIVQHRYIAGIGQAGFILSPYIASSHDFMLLASGLRLPTVRSFQIETRNRGLWSRDFDVKLVAMKIPQQQTLRSMWLIQPTQPPFYVRNPKGTQRPECNIDLFNGKQSSPEVPFSIEGDSLKLQGWTAISTSAGIGPDETWLSLTAPDGVQRFYRAGEQYRPDVNAAFHRPDMKNTGFVADLDLKGLTGQYRLNIYSIAGGVAFDCQVGKPLILDQR